MTDVHIAWAAGVYEGEGWCSLAHNGTGKQYWRVGIEMTDKDIIDRINNLFPCPSIMERTRAQWKTTYTWRLSRRTDIRNFLSKILPYLGDRRAHKALDALDQIELSQTKVK